MRFIKKILSVYIFIIVVLSPITIISNSIETEDCVNPNACKKHIIENVTYVGQKTNFYCVFASLTMALKYHGVNTTQQEVLYLSGGGYSPGYGLKLNIFLKRPFPIPAYFFRGDIDSEVSVGVKDMEFLSGLLGLKFSKYQYNCWNGYWKKLKECLIKDLPVVTLIDPNMWHPGEKTEHYNINPPIRSGHAIVIVGFNECNNSVCFNDPYPGYNNDSVNGTYQWIDVKDFRTSVRRAYNEFVRISYFMYVFEKNESPLQLDDMIKNAHYRNIQRIKGDKSVYCDEYTKTVRYFGVNALKAMKKDFGSLKFKLLIPYYNVLNRGLHLITSSITFPFFHLKFFCEAESETYQIMSEYLNETNQNLGNITLSNILKNESLILSNISNDFNNLHQLYIDLETSVIDNSIFESVKSSKNHITNIIIKIDMIIEEQEKIIQINEELS